MKRLSGLCLIGFGLITPLTAAGEGQCIDVASASAVVPDVGPTLLLFLALSVITLANFVRNHPERRALEMGDQS